MTTHGRHVTNFHLFLVQSVPSTDIVQQFIPIELILYFQHSEIYFNMLLYHYMYLMYRP